MAKTKSPGGEMMTPEDPYRERNFDKRRPVAGQSAPYVSGGQANDEHQTPRKTPAGAGHAPLAGPFKKS